MSHKIHNLFPIPIFTTKLPSKYSKITNFFNNQEMSRHSHEYGTFSDNDYILNSSECKEIKKYILTLVNEYGYNVLKYDHKKYKITQSWVSYKPPQTFHTRHTHHNSLISGVLFFGDYDKNTPSIYFHDRFIKLEYVHSIDVPKINDDGGKISFNFLPGTLLLFPSYLPHSVPLNTTTKTRKSLAFNTIPKKGLGDPGNLTELLF
jgi:uncharacterized protein (TIGR02466 family)